MVSVIQTLGLILQLAVIVLSHIKGAKIDKLQFL